MYSIFTRRCHEEKKITSDEVRKEPISYETPEKMLNGPTIREYLTKKMQDKNTQPEQKPLQSSKNKYLVNERFFDQSELFDF